MMNKNMILLTLTLLVSTVFIASVIAQNVPVGVETITLVQSERGIAHNASSVYAEAGNLTELDMTGVSQTKSWQGFYGNISGTLILEDSDGFRFYDWNAAEPQGEVYSSVNASPTWTDISCAPSLVNSAFLYQWETFYGMNNSDYDSINRTYNLTNHPTFLTGYRTLTGCPTTYTYVGNSSQSTYFPAALLSTDANTTLIFSTIIENRSEGVRAGIPGFDNGDYDFQLLVAEFGSNQNSDLTQYYFWVEIQ